MSFCPTCGSRLTATGCPTHGPAAGGGGGEFAEGVATALVPGAVPPVQATQQARRSERTPASNGPALPRAVSELSAIERGQTAHAAGLVLSLITFGFAGVLGPLAAYLLWRSIPDESRALSAAALNIQMVVTVGVWLAQPLGAFGDAVQWVLVITGVVAHVIATLRARSGDVWVPPRVPTVFH